MPASGLIQELVHGHGLNHSFALFYLLTFVRHARAEITLTANHDVTLSSNRRFEGDRLSAGLVGSIAFSSALIARMQPASLEPNPSLWTAVEVNLRTFRQWQTLTYQRHHGDPQKPDRRAQSAGQLPRSTDSNP